MGEKIKNIILGVLSALAKIPDFLLPSAWKGWRTIIFNTLSGIILALLAFDVQGFAEGVCNIISVIVHTWNAEYFCNTQGVVTTWSSITVFLNVLLRTITDTPVAKSSK